MLVEEVAQPPVPFAGILWDDTSMEKDTLLFRLYDQREAARALVDAIPERFFKSPNTLFADLAMGGGQYLAEVLRRCEKYHPHDQILPRLYGFEKNRVYLNCARGYNGLTGARLSTSSPFELTMKFDVIIGNPPYSLPKGEKKVSDGSKNLALRFIEKAVELLDDDGFISMITPLNFLKPTDGGRPTKSFSVLNGVYLSSITTGIKDKWFPKIGCNISQWTAHKNSASQLQLNGREWNLSETPFIVELSGDEIDLFAKIWKAMRTGPNPITCRRVGDGNIPAEGGWSLTERVNRRKLKDELWSSEAQKEKLEQIHISLPPDKANRAFAQPHVRFFMKATDIEPTLYHNLLNGLDFSPMDLTEDELCTINGFINR